MTLGESIRRIRQKKGLTQKQLGELCNMHEANVRKYELGRANPKIETIAKFANALQCSVEELMGLPENIGILNEKISSFEMLNNAYKTDIKLLSRLAEICAMQEKADSYLTECNTASEQISNCIAEYRQTINKLGHIYKGGIEAISCITEDNTMPEQIKKYVAKCNAISKQIMNYVTAFRTASDKLSDLSRNDIEFYSRMTKYETLFKKDDDTEIKINAENEISLADLESLFNKLNTNGKKEIFKRLEELTHLKQYTDK